MPEVDAVDVVVGWLDAMRRTDVPAVEAFFHADVVWRGIGHVTPCTGRHEVMELLEGSLEGRLGADAVEVIAGDYAAVLGAKVPGLRELGGVDLRGQLFNVFTVSGGKIVAVQDYAHRHEALAAAGAQPPRWR